MRWITALSAAFVLGAASTAQAQSEGTPTANYPIEIVHQYITVDVNADGTFTQTSDQLVLLKTQQGVQGLPAALVGYSDSIQEGDLLQVFTLKPDGKRIDAPVDQAIPRSSPLALQAPMFDDLKFRALPFQNVEVGDKVGWVTRIKQTKPYIPGQFSYAQVFSRLQPAHDVHVTITAPKDYPLHLDVAGLDNKPPTVVDGRNKWTWAFENDNPQAPEPGGVGEFDVAPHIVISSLRDWAALGKAYEDNAREKAAITSPIQELADTLTKDITDKREQARLLYEWVSANIKYVSVSLGVGAIVPHAAADVLSNRYGDCKDHAALLQSLLKAKGIDSTTVLINAGDSFQIATVAALQQFNHAITYIPAMKLYLDSTARYAPFGTLPPQDLDKTVLLTASNKLDRTPWDPAANVIRMVTTLKVHDDGSADGESKMSASGPFAISMRAIIAGIPPQQEQNFLRQVLGDNTGASLERGDSEKLVDPYEYGIHFKLPNYLQMPGPGAMSFSSGPRVPGRIGGMASVWAAPHQRDFVCGSGQFFEEVTVEFPGSIKISSLPKPQDITVDSLKLQTTYTREGDQTIKATRTLESTPQHHVCSAERAAALRADYVKLNGLLGSQALYE